MAFQNRYNLLDFVDFLIESTSKDPNKEWSFVNGQLHSLDSDEQPLYPINQLDKRYFIMKRVSSEIKTELYSLKMAALFKNEKRSEFIENDFNSVKGDFNYFAKWIKKIDHIIPNKSVRDTVTCVLLDDCAIFPTLSRFIASTYAAGNNLKIFVDQKHLVPALTFACFLHKIAGVPAGEVNIFPSTHETFPKNNLFCGSLIGLISEEWGFFTEITLSATSICNVQVKQHSLCPVLILKSADIDSVVTCIFESTQDVKAFWLPNVIYVQESIFKEFLEILKYAITLRSRDTEPDLNITRTECLNDFVSGRESEGYEVLIMDHQFHACVFIPNYEFAILPYDYQADYHLILILPVRRAEEGIVEINNGACLCASVWTNDAVQAISIPRSLECGTIWMNCIGYYDASAPLSLGNRQGIGSLSGKRTWFNNLVQPLVPISNMSNCPYNKERNSMLPKRMLPAIVKESLIAQKSWSKYEMEVRLNILDNIATSMEKNWDTHFKIIMDKTLECEWKHSINSLNFWSMNITESIYEQTLYMPRCLVICKSEPVGIIAILAGTVGLATLFFYVAGALAYGNTVIIGLSTDEPSCMIAVEFEQLFKHNSVTVLIDERDRLWRQFIQNKNIAAIWIHSDSKSDKALLPVGINDCKSVFVFNGVMCQKEIIECIETYATKSKCIWLPHL